MMARLKAFHAAMQALYLLMVGKHSYLMDTDEFIIDCTSKPDVAFPKAEAVHFYRLTANGPLDVTALVAWGGGGVDINTSDTSTPTHNQISGPITRARVHQLNNQVSSFLTSYSSY
jgi:hypothetical protein